MSPRPSDELASCIAACVEARRDLVCEQHSLEHRCGRFTVLRVASVDLTRPIVIVQAGLHGDEIAGPLTIARHLDVIANDAHARGVSLVIYPLVNPSGYDKATRYNGDHDKGRFGNGDFLRTQAADGSWTDGPGTAWRWSSEVDDALPAETRLVHTLLKREPLARVRGAIDLHQDRLSDLPPSSYAYVFGDRARYRGIVDRVSARVPLLANTQVGAGFGVTIDGTGRVTRAHDDGAHPTTDDDGLLERADGSFSDLFHRLGTPHSVAVETTGALPIDVACDVNLRWIQGIVALVQSERHGATT